MKRTLLDVALGAIAGAYVTAVWVMRNVPSLKELSAREHCPHCRPRKP